MEIGQTMARLRRDRGFTQKQLAVWLEVSEDYISKIECGKRIPPKKMLVRIAFILEVSMATLEGRGDGS